MSNKSFNLTQRSSVSQVKQMIVWQKTRMGLGQYFRGITEPCLFGIKGKLPYKTIVCPDLRLGLLRQQGVTGFVEPQTEHSKKPDKMRKMIELVSYPPRIELFARKEYEGWDSWGNQVERSSLFRPGYSPASTRRTSSDDPEHNPISRQD